MVGEGHTQRPVNSKPQLRNLHHGQAVRKGNMSTIFFLSWSSDVKLNLSSGWPIDLEWPTHPFINVTRRH